MTADLSEAKQVAFEAARAASPGESCGLFVRVRSKVLYWPCKNLAKHDNQNFVLDPDDYRSAEQAGEVVGIVHSHPDGFPLPSQADLASCELWGLPWHIVSPHLEGACGLWHSFKPSGYKARLTGREWTWGVHDCYALVRDWYREHGVELKDFARPDNPADFVKSPMFSDLFTDAGFLETNEKPQPGDCALMSIGRANGLNHIGVFTERMRLLHHLENRLSTEDVYGEGLRKATGKIIRHVACKNLALPR
jgi:proteasome lid subunit RPN8/RPN11